MHSDDNGNREPTSLLGAAASLKHIRFLLGHSRLGTVNIYAHIPPESLHKHVARWLAPNIAAVEDAVETMRGETPDVPDQPIDVDDP